MRDGWSSDPNDYTTECRAVVDPQAAALAAAGASAGSGWGGGGAGDGAAGAGAADTASRTGGDFLVPSAVGLLLFGGFRVFGLCCFLFLSFPFLGFVTIPWRGSNEYCPICALALHVTDAILGPFFGDTSLLLFLCSRAAAQSRADMLLLVRSSHAVSSKAPHWFERAGCLLPGSSFIPVNPLLSGRPRLYVGTAFALFPPLASHYACSLALRLLAVV